MNTILTWLSMGGYYSYVWSAFALVGSVLIINGLVIKIQTEQVKHRLTHWFKRNAL